MVGVWGFCVQYLTDLISKTKSVFQGYFHMSALVLCRPSVCSSWSRSTCAVGSEINSYHTKHFQSICLEGVKLQRELQLNLSFSQVTYKSNIIAHTAVAILFMPSNAWYWQASIQQPGIFQSPSYKDGMGSLTGS